MVNFLFNVYFKVLSFNILTLQNVISDRYYKFRVLKLIRTPYIHRVCICTYLHVYLTFLHKLNANKLKYTFDLCRLNIILYLDTI